MRSAEAVCSLVQASLASGVLSLSARGAAKIVALTIPAVPVENFLDPPAFLTPLSSSGGATKERVVEIGLQM